MWTPGVQCQNIFHHMEECMLAAWLPRLRVWFVSSKLAVLCVWYIHGIQELFQNMIFIPASYDVNDVIYQTNKKTNVFNALANLGRAVFFGIHSPLPKISSKWDHRYQWATNSWWKECGNEPIHCFTKAPEKLQRPKRKPDRLEKPYFFLSRLWAIEEVYSKSKRDKSTHKKLKTRVSQTAFFQHDWQKTPLFYQFYH